MWFPQYRCFRLPRDSCRDTAFIRICPSRLKPRPGLLADGHGDGQRDIFSSLNPTVDDPGVCDLPYRVGPGTGVS